MNKVQLAKTITSSVVGIGTAIIVSSIIKNNVTVDNPLSKVAVASSSLVLGWMVADLAKRYTDLKIDELVEMVEGIKSETTSEQ